MQASIAPNPLPTPVTADLCRIEALACGVSASLQQVLSAAPNPNSTIFSTERTQNSQNVVRR